MQNYKKNSFIVTTILVAAFSFACNPVYSPPVRVGHYGAPGNHQNPRKVEALVSGTDILPEAAFNFRFSPKIQLEVGGNYGGTFAMGFGGIRFTPTPINAGRKTKLTLDTELGLGLGAGGENGCDTEEVSSSDMTWGDCPSGTIPDDRDWSERFAFGGYAGLGLGINIDWFDAFWRGRYQQTKSTNIPTTSWVTTVTGIQFTIRHRVKLQLAAGVGAYLNQSEIMWGPLAEIGLSIYFGTLDKESQSAS